jgi:hypothetical protein
VKLSLWQAYNRELRAKEQEVKVRRDAEAFQRYYACHSSCRPPHHHMQLGCCSMLRTPVCRQGWQRL